MATASAASAGAAAPGAAATADADIKMEPLDEKSTGSAALAALQDTFESLLVQIGSVLHALPSAASHGPKPDNRLITRCNSHMRQFVPQALSRFHDNLDTLESELVRTQQVIRRDLLLSRIKREPADAAGVAGQEQQTEEQQKGSEHQQGQQSDEQQQQKQQQHDHDMADAPSAPDETRAAQGQAINGDSVSATDRAKAAAEKPEVDRAARSNASDNGNTNDDDLDAMFNDLTNPDPAPADGGRDDSAQQKNAHGTPATAAQESQTTATTTAAEADAAPAPATADDDAALSALLPGLDVYAEEFELPVAQNEFDGDASGPGNGAGNGTAFGDEFDFDELIQGFGGTDADDSLGFGAGSGLGGDGNTTSNNNNNNGGGGSNNANVDDVLAEYNQFDDDFFNVS